MDEPSTDDDDNAADVLVKQENLSNYDNLSERLEENKIDLHSLLFFCGGGIDEGENNWSGCYNKEGGVNIEGEDDLGAAEGDAKNPEQDNLENSLPEQFKNLNYN